MNRVSLISSPSIVTTCIVLGNNFLISLIATEAKIIYFINYHAKSDKSVSGFNSMGV